MRIPLTAERIKEVPAQALRAVFAGVGQVLLIGERVRRRAGGDGQEAGAAPVTAETAPTAQADAATETNAPKTSAPKASTGKASTGKTSAPKASAPKATKAPAKETEAKAPATEPASTETPAAEGTTSVLPVPHYSELSVASLRARLRGLDVAQVRELIGYERAHEDRENVIAMFERRIAKLEEAGDADPAKG